MPTLAALAIRVVVVTFQPAPLARVYLAEMSPPFPVLVDESRELYRAYGMGKARAWDLWGPATWWAYLKEGVRGRLPRRPQGDPAQQGGDVLIDPDGVVRLHHVGRGPADRPRITALLAARTQADAQGGNTE